MLETFETFLNMNKQRNSKLSPNGKQRPLGESSVIVLFNYFAQFLDRTSTNNVENNNQDMMQSKNVSLKKRNKKKAPSSYSHCRTPVKKFKSISTRPLEITSQPVEKTIDTPQVKCK